MNTPKERVGYHGVTHEPCGHFEVREVRGTEAEQDAMHALLRSRPCLACQQTARYQAPAISASMDHEYPEAVA